MDVNHDAKINAEKSKKAVLVVSFGTSFAETRAKTIDKLEAAVAAAFPERRLYRAWTSKMIINKVRSRDGMQISTVAEVLQQMQADGVDDLLVQPTHILPGVENDLMLADIQAQAENFAHLAVGQPLLSSTDDMFKMIDIVAQELDNEPDTALILMGHGTKHYINPVYAALDYMFKEVGHSNIFVGTVESYPNLDNVLGLLKKTPYLSVRLAPFMIVAGNHVINDMAGDEADSWKNRMEEAGYKVDCLQCGLGEFDGVADLLCQHALAAQTIK